MAEVTAIVNARPIVPVSTDADSPMILTPSTLLTQKTCGAVEGFQHLGVRDMYQTQWKHVHVLAETFWNRWRSEYLPTIQTRCKWNRVIPNLKEGDVILMKDNDVSRNEWPTGVILRVFPSDDGLVRKVEVRVVKDGKQSVYIRPITEIVSLVSDN